MRKLLFLSILFLIGLIGKAQKVYFIYLESENATPFYVKMGDKVYSSSFAGYLILSNLVDSTYGFSIGLSGKRADEPKFQVTVSGKDQGFLIKELDQKLNLFNLQSLELIASLATIETRNETYTTRTDNFTRTLSLAVNDPTLLLEVVKTEPVKTVIKEKSTPDEIKSVVAVVKEVSADKLVITDSSMPNAVVDTATVVVSQPVLNKTDSSTQTLPSLIKDSIAVALVDTFSVADTAVNTVTATPEVVVKEEDKKEEVEEEAKIQDLRTAPKKDSGSMEPATIEVAKDSLTNTTITAYQRYTIIRRSESSTTEGFGLTFIDQMPESSDTIRILIPNPKVIFKTQGESSPEVKEETKEVNEALKTIKDIVVTPQMDTATLAYTQQIDSVAKQAGSTGQTDSTEGTTKHLNGCAKVATDQDYQNLRKEMAVLDTDVGMINTATSVFNEKCFTTEQVKSLSTLFSKAQWKFLFFEAAYKHIADAENFASLESEIKDDYYIYRFKVLIAK